MMLALMFGFLLQAQGSPVAMVLQADNGATVVHAGASHPARIAELLYADDRVTTGAGGKVTLGYCPTNQKLALMAGSSVVLGAASFKTAAGAAPQADSFKCMLPKVALGAENLERVGAMRGRGDPAIPLYTGGAVTSARPMFKWEPVAGAKTYKIVVSNDDTDDVVWSVSNLAPISQVQIDVPSPLKPGISYRWELTAEADGKVIGRQSAIFEVKPNADLASIPLDPALQLQRAITLESAGYFAESADTFRQLRAAQPDDPRFTQHLIWLYWNAKLIEASNRELARRTP